MKIIRHWNILVQNPINIVAVLGNFDGIHKGHQQLLKESKKIAKELNMPLAVISFEPHPIEILREEKNIRITSLKEKIRILQEYNIDILYLFRFTKEFASITADQFLHNILINNLYVKHIVMGHDFIFGYQRKGNATFLKDNATKYNYGFSRIEPLNNHNNILYSSSNIRKFLKEGNIKQVNEFLGRNYSIEGRVIDGNKMGRNIGFPTANIRLRNLLLMKFGVYAVKVYLLKDNIYLTGIANIGVKPSFGDNEVLLEVHIFNFDKNIYDKSIRVEFIDFIRAEQKFPDKNLLKQQISKDCLKVTEIFK